MLVREAEANSYPSWASDGLEQRSAYTDDCSVHLFATGYSSAAQYIEMAWRTCTCFYEFTVSMVNLAGSRCSGAGFAKFRANILTSSTKPRTNAQPVIKRVVILRPHLHSSRVATLLALCTLTLNPGRPNVLIGSPPKNTSIFPIY